MKKKNAEVTGKKVASIAGRILKLDDRKLLLSGSVWCWEKVGNTYKIRDIGTLGELKALAASALTQAEDKFVYVDLNGKPIKLHNKPLFATVTTTHGKHSKTSKQPIVRSGYSQVVTHKTPKRKPARKGRKA